MLLSKKSKQRKQTARETKVSILSTATVINCVFSYNSIIFYALCSYHMHVSVASYHLIMVVVVVIASYMLAVTVI